MRASQAGSVGGETAACVCSCTWLIRMLASAVMPATATAMCLSIMYIFSEDLVGSSSLEESFFSAASTMPSEARIPIAVPACEIASIAYSTW